MRYPRKRVVPQSATMKRKVFNPLVRRERA
jgi:hypothetical protein